MLPMNVTKTPNPSHANGRKIYLLSLSLCHHSLSPLGSFLSFPLFSFMLSLSFSFPSLPVWLCFFLSSSYFVLRAFPFCLFASQLSRPDSPHRICLSFFFFASVHLSWAEMVPSHMRED